MALGDLITQSDAAMTAVVTSLALPESVNRLSDVTPESRASHLILVNHFDFLCAVEQKGPDWHSYDRANTDLKFVANLFGAGIGFLTANPTIKSPDDIIGKCIAVLPRPSAIRAIAEIVLRDGWGILDQVELVDDQLAPGSEGNADSKVDVHVVTTIETNGGYKLVAPLPSGSDPSLNWVEIDERTIDRMTVASGVTFDRLIHPLLKDCAIPPFDQGTQLEAGLVRFDQGLSAWNDAAPDFVAELLGLLVAEANRWVKDTGGVPFDVERLRNWAPLDDSYIHEGAKQFYPNYGA